MVMIARLFDGTYRAWCPALPGGVVHGFSRSEAGTRAHQAVSGYLKHPDVALGRELARQIAADYRTVCLRAPHTSRAEEPLDGGT
jgi:hypothetical protein